MSLDYFDEYARQIVLRDIGPEGQERLLGGRVAIIGLGGLGSPAAMLLASMGVGFLRIVDRDIVSITDLHRQPLYSRRDVDKPKVEAARERLLEINPGIEVEAVPAPVTPDNVDDIVSDVDVVIDGLDNMMARYIINRAVVRHRKPYIFASAIEMYGNISAIIPFETPCLECFYGGLDDAGLPTCAEVGVHPSITHLVASISVSEAARVIMGKEPVLKNTLLYIDLRNISMDKIKILRNEECPVCGSRASGKPRRIKLPLTEVSCARDGTGIIFVNNIIPELNLKLVADKIRGLGFTPIKQSGMSISFKVDENISCVILSSGVMIGKIKIYRDDINDRILEIYREILGAEPE